MTRRRTVDEAAADAAVLGALRARGGTATRADLVVATALPEMVVERALGRLLDDYDSAVGVAKGGVLVYRFAPTFRRRAERRRVLRALLATVARTSGAVIRGARAVFRVLLAVQLIVYMFAVLLPVSVVAGIIAGIVFFIMMLFSDGGGDLLSIMTEPTLAVIVLGLFALGGIGWAFSMKYALLMELVGAKPLDARASGLDGLVARVNAFAVGPDVPRRKRERTDRTTIVSPADERRVLARVRAAGGRLRAGDLVRWLGLPFDAADSQTTRFLVEYGGEPEALGGQAPDGSDEADATSVLEVRFPSLLATTGGQEPRDEPTAFERADPAPRFSANPPRADGFVALFAVINLVAGLIGWHYLGRRADTSAWWWLAWVAGAVVPVGFSILLLGLPVLRAPVLAWKKARRLAALARGRVVRALCTHAAAAGDTPVDLEQLARLLPERADEPRLSPSEMRAVALELGGEFDLDEARDPSKTVWRFRRLGAELAARAALPRPAALGGKDLVEQPEPQSLGSSSLRA